MKILIFGDKIKGWKFKSQLINVVSVNMFKVLTTSIDGKNEIRDDINRGNSV